jgi:hypothetical protein
LIDQTYKDVHHFHLTVETIDTHAMLRWHASLYAIEIDLMSKSKHAIFSHENVIASITTLIENKSVKITRNPAYTDETITVTFTLTMHGDILPEIHDDLTIPLYLCERSQTTNDDSSLLKNPIEELVKLAKEQDKEIKRLAGIVANYGTFAREVAINARITRIIGLYGPLSRRSYTLAQRVFAAEVDGAPIVFRVLGCDAPIWLQSVIRFVNASEPSKDCPILNKRRDQILDNVDEINGGLGNAMSSRTMTLYEWIKARSIACKCNILVILPVHDSEGKQDCFISEDHGVFHNPIIHQHCHPFSSKITCVNKTVIFGNPFVSKERSKECAVQLDALRTSIAPWLTSCTNVHIADIKFEEPPTCSTSTWSYPGDFIYQYSEEVYRAYEAAEDANPWLDIVQKKWIYPTRITNISCNLAH